MRATAISGADATLGYKGDKGSPVVTAEYSDEKVVNGADREFRFPRGQFHPTLGWTTVAVGRARAQRSQRKPDACGDPYNITNYHPTNPAAPNAT